jgi:hypothetical protein
MQSCSIHLSASHVLHQIGSMLGVQHVVPEASTWFCRRLAAGPDLRGALLVMAYLAQYPMTAALLCASQVGAAVLPLRRVRGPTLQHMQLPRQQGLMAHGVSSRLPTSMVPALLMRSDVTVVRSSISIFCIQPFRLCTTRVWMLPCLAAQSLA